MNKDKETLLHEQKTSEELLMEIRNLLTKKQDEQHHGFLSNHDIDHLLKDSLKKTELMLKKQPKNQNQHKIEHINHVLQNQQNFIQNYAKEKVRSEVFSSLRQNISEGETNYYQQNRQSLLRRREIEEAEERERQDKVIESTKKFLKYEVKNLPYKEINEFMMKEGEASLPYLLNQTAESATTSINNKINEQKIGLQQLYEEQKLSKVESSHNSSPNKIHEVSMEDEKIQIFDDDHTMNQSYVREQAELELQETLKRQPKFLKAFKYFLLNQINLHKFINEEPQSERHRSSTKRSETTFKYSNKPIVFSKQPKVETIGQLLSKYKVKGIVLKDMGLRSIVKQAKPICQKVVSKMNGQSFSFHPKKVVLTEKQLIWCEQKQETNEQSKRSNLIIQDIVVSRTKKQEGGFFSKTSSDIDIVHVKGSNRDIKFEKNYLEGADVYQQLCNLMANKVYHLNVIVGCQINEQLKKFVLDKKATILNFSNQFLQSHQKYPNKDYRLMIVKIFAALFETRKEVASINLASCKLNILQINTFVKQFSHFTKVQKIVISETKFNPETMIVLSKYISSLTADSIQIVLPTCLIDDNILIKAKEHFIKCTNISKLNLSMNDFTMEGFTVLIDLCSQPECMLSQLNVSACKINNIISVGQLVKKAKKLEVLRADDCGLSFQSSQQMAQFFQCCRNSKLKKISLLQNDIVNNLKPFEDFWLNDTPKQIMVNLGIFNQKTSKNLQGKLL